MLYNKKAVMGFTVWSSLLRTTIAIYKNRSLFQNWWIKLLAYTDAGQTDIAVLGRANVGKSVLSSHLHGEASNLSFDIPSTSSSVEIKAIQIGEWTQLVRVIPGQDNRNRADALRENFNNQKIQGVIYVVDWGYTDVRSTTFKEKLIKEDKLDTIEKIRAYNMERELDDLRDVLKVIKDSHLLGKGPKWLVIAVNKVDLFHDQIDEAQRYYDPTFDSRFTTLIKTTMNDIGAMNMKVVALPLISWDTNFEWAGEKIESMTGGKEDVRNLTKNFISAIVELSN